jgi:hypothetical protein
MNAEIIRVEQSNEGIFGVLKLEGRCFCVTLELPWVNNQNEISAIPKGEYTCYRVQSPSQGEVWQLQNVPNRKHVLIHAGNTTRDTLGCILVAQFFGKLQGNRAVLNSGTTFNQFMEVTRQVNRLDLTIDSYRELSKLKVDSL